MGTIPSKSSIEIMFYCEYCGIQLKEGVKYCPMCGKYQKTHLQSNSYGTNPYNNTRSYQEFSRTPYAYNSQNKPTTIIVKEGESNGFGTAGFVFALLSFLVCWIPVVDFIVWFLGALFSFIGLFKRPRGLAIVGFVLSFIGLFVLLLFVGALIGIAEAFG